MGARHASARASARAEFQSEGLSSHEPRLVPARLLSGDICVREVTGELRLRGRDFEWTLSSGAHLDAPRALRRKLRPEGSRCIKARRGGRLERLGRGVEGGAGREAQAVLGQAALERRPLHRQQLARVIVIHAPRLLALVRIRVRG